MCRPPNAHVLEMLPNVHTHAAGNEHCTEPAVGWGPKDTSSGPVNRVFAHGFPWIINVDSDGATELLRLTYVEVLTTEPMRHFRHW